MESENYIVRNGVRYDYVSAKGNEYKVCDDCDLAEVCKGVDMPCSAFKGCDTPYLYMNFKKHEQDDN